MSVTMFASPRSLPNPTQDQLDDLEALIDRMLQLPVVEVGEGPNAGAPASQACEFVTISPPTSDSSVADQSSVLVTGHQGQTKESGHLQWPAPHRPFPPQPPKAGSGDAPSGEGTTSAPMELHGPTSHSIGKPAAAQDSRLPGALLFPFAAVTWVFDLYTMPFGPAGRWLRGRSGRKALGAAGTILLAAAGAWALIEWMGWLY